MTTLLVDPTSSGVVLAGTDRGLFRSSDAEASFQPVTFPAGLPQAIEDVTWTGGDRFVLAAGHTWLDPAGGAVLLMSSDRGRTWRLPTGLADPSDFLTFAVAAAPSDRRRLYALASHVDLDLGEIFTRHLRVSSAAMSELATAARSVGFIAMSRRVAVALTISIGVGLLLLIPWKGSPSSLFLYAITLGLAGTTVFSLFEVWPRRLPRWIQRWVLQVVAVGIAMPVTIFTMHRCLKGTNHDWLILAFASVLFAPWTALAAIVQQKEAFARHQKLAFALEKSELERQALDARLHLLQAQVAPHFLFNTLANVQALVDTGSPHASTLLRSLTEYLRAAVPRLNEPAATIERELQLVRPYLELMQMRMPDRLQYAMNVDPSALAVRCPPTTLLTLVENAVRHGIDPSEEGGRIDIDIERLGARCVVRVTDTGVGLHPSGAGLGTGLTTLRERLQLIFGDAAQLRLISGGPRGVAVEVDLPAQA